MPYIERGQSDIINVEFSNHQYPILIGKSLENYNLCEYSSSHQFLIVTHKNLHDLYSSKLRFSSPIDIEINWCFIEEGEIHKANDSLQKVLSQAIKLKYRRNSCFIAFGGGVIGDITGFAASIYQRGVELIQIPTTILSQVDSSIGGKTAINHPLGKNMIGTFYQPNAVVIDTSLLETLPKSELVSGLAEVIKYALINDAPFFDWLDANIDNLLTRDTSAINYAVNKSCKHKQAIVEVDEKEKGVRALLNLGHTFGHALEALTNYEKYLHGEAISIGMVIASEVSKRMSLITQEEHNKIVVILKKAGLPVSIDSSLGISIDSLINQLFLDKKNVKSSALKTILLKGIGKAFILEDTPIEIVKDVLGKSFS